MSAIAAQRLARGLPEGECRPGRTTVYDAFRTGRRRLDTGLVLEIVEALGVDEAGRQRWAERCRAAVDGPRDVAKTPDDAPVVLEVSEVSESTSLVASGLPALKVVLMLLGGCIALNVCGHHAVEWLGLPLYFDMVGTAVAAIFLGPWWGALVGLLTNVLGVASSGASSLPFAAVNIAGALVWGYGVRRYGSALTIPRYFVLNIAVALACTLVAAPIIVIMFGGETGHSTDTMIGDAAAFSHNLVLAVVGVNLLTSVADKMIAGFVALVALEMAPRSWIAGSYALSLKAHPVAVPPRGQ
ncbi:MAG: hypothetical protein WB767_18020 [Nocardioides sp.]